MTYVLDTNIITAILKDNEKIKRIARRKALEGKKIFINGISYYEIKRGLLAANATTKLTKFESLCKTLGLVLLDTRDIFDIASKVYANLKQRGELLKDADILICWQYSGVWFIKWCGTRSTSIRLVRIACFSTQMWLCWFCLCLLDTCSAC
jgi:tRNA(fMet)-specific endonuclease VapC